MPDVVSAPAPLNGEKLISFAAASKLFPAFRGSAPHTNGSTVFRWATRGSKAAGGALVKLEAVRVGSRWLTSVEAVNRFVAAMTAASTPPATTPAPSPAARNRAAEAASKELDRALGAR
jgi:hypothetical protein